MAKVELVNPDELQQEPSEDISNLDLPDFDFDDNSVVKEEVTIDKEDVGLGIAEVSEKPAGNKKKETGITGKELNSNLRKSINRDARHEELLLSDLSYGFEKLKSKVLQTRQLENDIERLSFRLKQKDAETLVIEDEKKQLIALVNAERLDDKRKLKEYEVTLFEMKKFMLEKDKNLVALKNMAEQYKHEAVLRKAKVQELVALLGKKQRIAKDADMFTRKVTQKRLSELQKSKDESYNKIELMSGRLQELDTKLKDKDNMLKSRDMELFKLANERKVTSEKMIKQLMEAHLVEKAELNLEIEKLKRIIKEQNDLLKGKDETYERMIAKMMNEREDLQKQITASRKNIGVTRLTADDKERILKPGFPPSSVMSGLGVIKGDMIPLPPASLQTSSRSSDENNLVPKPAPENEMFEILSMIDIALENGDSMENIRLSLLNSGYKEHSIKTAFSKLGV